jgi:phytoene synthase
MDQIVTLGDISPDIILATHGKSFHWARHLLGSIHAARATRLYAFCRWIDDIADHVASNDTAEETLLGIKQQIKMDPNSNKRVQDISELMRECKMDPELLSEFIDGAASDLTHVPFTDQEVLLRYCYRVAGTVGLMMCRVLDVSCHAAYQHAIDLGIAMQLTNICRDVSEDAQRGRRYIPTTIIGDILPEQLINPSPEISSIVVQAVKQLLELADRYYHSGEAGLAFLPYRARLGMAVAGKLYQGIGGRLRRSHYAYWKQRARVGVLEKSAITMNVLAGFLLRSSRWPLPQNHDALLHVALQGLPYTDTWRYHDSSP